MAVEVDLPRNSRKESSRSLGRVHSSKQAVLVELPAHSHRVELAGLQLG